jgi:putative transposase
MKEKRPTFSDAFDLVHRREAERPNAIWQADHTLLDILVQRESENPAQPWPRVILDDYSRAVAGLFLFFEAPSAAQTALAALGVIAKRLLLDFTLAPFRRSRLRIVSADVVIDRFA